MKESSKGLWLGVLLFVAALSMHFYNQERDWSQKLRMEAVERGYAEYVTTITTKSTTTTFEWIDKE